jgi:predicted lactoylglutathione lyase
MVDSGSGETLIANDRAQLLKVKPVPTGEKRLGIGGETEARRAKIKGTVVGLPDSAFKSLTGDHIFMPLQEHDIPGLGSSFGVIGMAELAAAGAVVNLQDQTFSINPVHCPPGYQEIPLHKLTFGNTFIWGVKLEINGQPSVMIVDTGAQATVLAKAFAKTHKIPLVDSNVVATGADGKPVAMPAAKLEHVRLEGGEINFDGITAYAVDMGQFGTDVKDAHGKPLPTSGILGLDQMLRSKAILDCKNGKMYLTQASRQHAIEPVTDGQVVTQALYALAAHGDEDAKKILAKAQSGGAVPMSPEEAGAIVAKAREKGLLQALPAGLDPRKISQAIQALALAGDVEAKAILDSAQKSGGAVQLTADQGAAFVKKAVDRGLMK